MLTEFKSLWKRAFDFKGRSTRRDYWVSYLWTLAIEYILLGFTMGCIFLGIDYTTGDLKVPFIIGMVGAFISIIYLIVLFVPLLSLCIRRCHDAGFSGWYYLFCILGCFLCGLGGIGWIVICVLDSKPENQWGPNPKDELLPENTNNKSIGLAIGVFVLSIIFYIVAIAIGSFIGAGSAALL